MIELGQYIWRSKSTDFPVTVTGSAGMGPDGRLYVTIAGSSTAIPADELIKNFKQESRQPVPKKLF